MLNKCTKVKDRRKGESERKSYKEEGREKAQQKIGKKERICDSVWCVCV